MRNFFHAHWKVIVALILLILVAVLTVSPTATSAAPAHTTGLAKTMVARAGATQG